MIHYLKQHEIDKQKWDDCIRQSPNGLLYGYSWYLDRMAENWDALVEDDYISVFPLPWKQKYLIKYVYQPFFTQQLGLFSKNEINQEKIKIFIQHIPPKFLKVFINLNFSNRTPLQNLVTKTNLVLRLGDRYENIVKNFKRDVGKTLRNAAKAKLIIDYQIFPKELINLYKRDFSMRHPNIKSVDYDRLISLCEWMADSGNVYISSIYDVENKLCGGLIVLKCDKRHQCIINYQTETGRIYNSQYVLMNDFIQRESNKDKILDFGGSEIPSIAMFLKKFGPETELYYHFEINRLLSW